MPSIKKLKFADGTTVTAPTSLNIDVAQLSNYASDALFVAAKGSAAETGNIYYNTQLDGVRYCTVAGDPGTWVTALTSDLALSTDEVSEGDLNLYYTDSRVEGFIGIEGQELTTFEEYTNTDSVLQVRTFAVDTNPIGQTFTFSSGETIGEAGLYLSGTATGTVVYELYATSAGLPTGAVLATSNRIDVSTLTGSAALTLAEFPVPLSVTSGVHVLVLNFSGLTSGSISVWGNNEATDYYTDGTHVRYNGSVWLADLAGWDTAFQVNSATSGSSRVGIDNKTYQSVTPDTFDVQNIIDKLDAAIPTTTSSLTEGSNLYYTDVRADGRITLQKGAVNGVASLDAGGVIPSNQLPPISLTKVDVVASEVAQLALTTEEGDVVVRTDEQKTYMRNAGLVGDMTDFTELASASGGTVLSVNGQTGVVSLGTDDITEGSTNVYYTDTRVETLMGIEGVSPTVIATNTDASASISSSIFGSIAPMGQTFTVSTTTQIASVALSLIRDTGDSPIGSFHYDIYATAGGIPTGAVLYSTETFNANTLPEYPTTGLTSANFTVPPTLTPADYAIVLNTDSITGGDLYYVFGVTPSAYADGDFVKHNGSIWEAHSTHDAGFAVTAIGIDSGANKVGIDNKTYQSVTPDTFDVQNIIDKLDALRGSVDGVASLDGGGKVPSNQLSLDVGDLDDVTTTAPINDEILTYQGGSWVNSTPPSSDLPDVYSKLDFTSFDIQTDSGLSLKDAPSGPAYVITTAGTEASYDTLVSVSSNNTWNGSYGNSFDSEDMSKLDQVEVLMQLASGQQSVGTAECRIKVYDSATNGAVPIGISDMRLVSSLSLTGSSVLKAFTFSTSIDLTPDTTYYFQLELHDPDGATNGIGRVGIMRGEANPYAGGTAYETQYSVTSISGWTANASGDVYFILTGTEASSQSAQIKLDAGEIKLQEGTEGTIGHVWTSKGVLGEGNWVAPTAGSGANSTLSNLTSPTSINQSLLPSGGTQDLGSFASPWDRIYFDSKLSSMNGGNIGVELGTLTNPHSGGTSSGLFAPNNVDLGLSTQNITTGTGDVFIETGNASAGSSGNLNLSTGTASGVRGSIKFVDGSEGTSGQVWTSTGTGGEGNWVAPTKNKFQTKLFNGSQTSSGTLITFNGLTIGNVYKVSSQVRGGAAGLNTADIKENSVVVGHIEAQGSGGSGYSSATFTATGTTATIEWVAGTLSGDNTKSQTFASIEDCKDMVVTTDFT